MCIRTVHEIILNWYIEFFDLQNSFDWLFCTKINTDEMQSNRVQSRVQNWVQKSFKNFFIFSNKKLQMTIFYFFYQRLNSVHLWRNKKVSCFLIDNMAPSITDWNENFFFDGTAFLLILNDVFCVLTIEFDIYLVVKMFE